MSDDDRSISGIESTMATILESLHEFVLYYDLDMNLLYVNEAACAAAGISSEELRERRCWNVWNQRETPCIDCPVITAMKTGEPCAIEKTTADGRSWIVKGYPVKDNEGLVIGGVETTLEITERKKSEAALQESEARFRQIASTARERNVQLMAINKELKTEIAERRRAERRQSAILRNIPDIAWLKDRDSRFIAVNEPFARACGWAAADLVGKNDLDIWPREMAVRYRADDAEVMATAKRKTVEEPLSDVSGEIKWIETIKTPIFDDLGKLIGTTGIARDITKRRQLEQDLIAERERLAVTLHSIGDAVITTDRDGRIALMNPIAEQLTGWKEADAAGRELMEVFRIENQGTGTPCESPVDKVLESGQIVGLTNHTILVARDGQHYTIADSGAPIKNVDGYIIGVVLVFRDITAQQRTEAELLKMEKLKSLGVLAGGIAHDFNNFLTGIIGNLSLAKLDLQPGDPVLRSMKEMEKAAMRAKELTQQLLTFSKGGEPVKHTANIAAMTREAVQFALRGSNVRCHFDLADDLMAVEVDEGQIAQVIHNLIINADQAMPDGGAVWIRGANMSLAEDNPFALLPGNYVQLVVEDNGTGIHPDHSQNVFDPYFTTKQKGSGLGLAVAYNIVAKHDGQLTVRSEFGEGSTFTIFLPASAFSPMRYSEKREGIVSGQGRVLVMDDEDYIRELAETMLTKLGYEVELAEDGQTAVDLYRKAIHEKRPFDAVILDLTVPGGMGGKEAISHLVGMDKKVRAIVSSGYSNDPVMSDYTEYGFLGVVHKPYMVQEMSQMLKSVIG